VVVAYRKLENANAVLARSGLEVEAITKAQAAAFSEEAAAIVRADAAMRAARAGGGGSIVLPPGGGGVGGAGGAAEEDAAIVETTGLYAGLGAQLLELIAVYETYRAIRDAVAAGGQFDATIESARLGIAAITSAYGTLTDAQGQTLTGQNALNAALGIADDQLTKLQADAVRVAVPFAALADTMRGIEGAGLHAGASLDQIRELTTSAALAATALGTPYEQLNTTLVQLLEGHVRVTNQLVAHLGLSNQLVHQWQEQGTLVSHLLDTFQKFEPIAERIQGTWRGIGAEIKNAFDIVMGASVRSALTELETGLRNALGQVFNLDTGQLRAQFQGLVTMVGDGLAGAARLVVDAIQAGVSAAEQLAQWFTANRDRVEQLGRDALSIVESFGRILADGISIVAKVEEWYASSLLIQAVWKGIADAVGFVADHVTAIAAVGAVALGIRALANTLPLMAASAGIAGVGIGEVAAALLALINPVTLGIAVV